jgi:ubiquitin
MNLIALAKAAADVAGIAAGVGPVVSNVAQLGTLLKQLGSDLQAAPIDTTTGKPMTLEAAQAHLAAARAASHTQDDTIRANALKALAENEAEGTI